MFSFGLTVRKENGNIVLYDSLSDVTIKLFYDELVELHLAINLVNEGKQPNINTKLSSQTNINLARTKEGIAFSIGGLDLKLTLGQSKAIEFLFSKLLTFWPLVEIMGNNSITQSVMLSEVASPITNTKKPSQQESKIEKLIEPQPVDTRKVKLNGSDSMIDITSAILSAGSINQEKGQQLMKEINNILGTNYPFNLDVLNTIIDTTKRIVTDKDIILEQYRNNEYEQSNQLLKDLWATAMETRTEQDKRLAIATYYIIQQIIEVNELLGGL